MNKQDNALSEELAEARPLVELATTNQASDLAWFVSSVADQAELASRQLRIWCRGQNKDNEANEQHPELAQGWGV